MARRTAGFISKRPHKKSRGGCTTCKRKKVKCDEALPSCAYCAQRDFECIYQRSPNSQRSPSDTSEVPVEAYDPVSQDIEEIDIEDFNYLGSESSLNLLPAAQTAIGTLASHEIELLNQYQATTWTTVTVRKEEPIVEYLTKTWAPQAALSNPHLLYTILSISASHSNSLVPSPRKRHLADVYRQKAFSAYNKSLQNITNDNYETVLLASMYIQVMVPPPTLPCTDAEMLAWVSSMMHITQGIRLIAGLKWSFGFEHLNVFPLFKRELCILPPPPDTLSTECKHMQDPHPSSRGDSPSSPNHPTLYETPSKSSADTSSRPHSNSVFLPPALTALLDSITTPPDTGPLDLHRGTLLRALHALSPMFLTIYHYHLSTDLYVRVSAFPTFLTKEFLVLVSDREPRTLVVVGWWLAFFKLLPTGWWFKDVIPRALQSISNLIMRSNNKILMDAIEGAYRMVRLEAVRGKEAAARGIFEDWNGVDWKHGISSVWEVDEFADLGG
ncbi:hypothetical protein BU24DRAFT_354912 [Aaosphaeria arxii CBS 175.79]|uniref:Zn(2)-C6 fungal-type domain-containing protein n=1 Tax=Aaosphaeria arxii CBS 175.79 TaxID=1450172 RepID=A0A6A5XG08_9PLEO|nr:uncharacterized protein BU24DRAFT_354912 [Aaosphaeria arxii CBS 175.79]KAF2011304.1 hypothetical protein BU24DRAFT_354912 [Aaosphaeria arxii CBS 175.79]